MVAKTRLAIKARMLSGQFEASRQERDCVLCLTEEVESDVMKVKRYPPTLFRRHAGSYHTPLEEWNRWPPHIFRTMIMKLCGKKSHRPRVESKLALLEPYKVKKQWATAKRAKRLVEQGQAWADKVQQSRILPMILGYLRRLEGNLGKSFC